MDRIGFFVLNAVVFASQGTHLDMCNTFSRTLPASTVCQPTVIKDLSFNICRRTESDYDYGVIVRELNRDSYGYGKLRMLGAAKGIAVDFGCNIGLASMMLAQYAPGIIIHCFEPIPETCAYAASNVKKNGLEQRVIVHCCGVAPESRNDTFNYYAQFPGGSGDHREREGQNFQFVTVGVRLVSLGEVLREILDLHPEPMKLLAAKIDCEGCEGIASPLLEQMMDYEPRLNTPYISGEYHPWHFTKTMSPYTLLGWTVDMLKRFVCHTSKRRLEVFEHCPSVGRTAVPDWARIVNGPRRPIAGLNRTPLRKCSLLSGQEQATPCNSVSTHVGKLRVCGSAKSTESSRYLNNTLAKFVEDLTQRKRSRSTASRGMAIVIGCGLGLEAMMFALADPELSVHCFEQQKSQCSAALDNVKSNKLDKRVTVHCCGLVELTEPKGKRKARNQLLPGVALRAIMDAHPVESYGKVEAIYLNCGGCEGTILPQIEHMLGDHRINTDYLFGVFHKEAIKSQSLFAKGWTYKMTERIACSGSDRKVDFHNC